MLSLRFLRRLVGMNSDESMPRPPRALLDARRAGPFFLRPLIRMFLQIIAECDPDSVHPNLEFGIFFFTSSIASQMQVEALHREFALVSVSTRNFGIRSCWESSAWMITNMNQDCSA